MVQEVHSVCSSPQGEGAAAKVEEKEPKSGGEIAGNQTLPDEFLCLLSGRVHSAMVSKLNPGQRSVTVEWYERGETKGKEVELDVLLELNPELIRNKQYVAAPQPTATAPINLQRVSTKVCRIRISTAFPR
jgi:hypothetical protein